MAAPRAAILGQYGTSKQVRIGCTVSAARRVLLASGESINKREDNIARDKRVNQSLRRQGWKVIRIWQHSLKKSPDACLNRIRRALDL